MEIEKVRLEFFVRDLVRRSIVVTGELRHGLLIGSLCAGRHASQDHVLDHLFAELCHGGTSLAAQKHGHLRARDDARGGHGGE